MQDTIGNAGVANSVARDIIGNVQDTIGNAGVANSVARDAIGNAGVANSVARDVIGNAGVANSVVRDANSVARDAIGNAGVANGFARDAIGSAGVISMKKPRIFAWLRGFLNNYIFCYFLKRKIVVFFFVKIVCWLKSFSGWHRWHIATSRCL